MEESINISLNKVDSTATVLLLNYPSIKINNYVTDTSAQSKYKGQWQSAYFSYFSPRNIKDTNSTWKNTQETPIINFNNPPISTMSSNARPCNHLQANYWSTPSKILFSYSKTILSSCCRRNLGNMWKEMWSVR